MKNEIVSRPVEDPAAWLASDLRADPRWRWRLDAASVGEIDDAVRRVVARGLRIPEIARDDFPLPTLAAVLRERGAELEKGRGFFLLQGLPVGRWSSEEAALALWGIGVHLGTPEPQDKAGNLMHDVRDTGQSVDGTDNVRGYQTTEELQFHNDGADAFILLCLRTAKSGGVSKLVSAVSIFNEIVRTRPDLAEVLQQPFHFDARAQHPGETKVQSVPIFTFHAGRLSVLYKRRYIELAQRFPEVPRLTPLQIEALDTLDRLCADLRFCLEFSLEPGDLEVGNNFVTLHSRTTYVDHDEPALKRHMKRLWISIPDGRDVAPPYRDTREFKPTYLRRRREAARA